MKRTLIIVITLAVIFAVALNIPGNIESIQSKESKLPPIPTSSKLVEVHFLDTAHFQTPEAFTVSGGSIFKTAEMIHGAILVTHESDSFLFDTGLGENVDSQFKQDMPAFLVPFMSYQKGQSVLAQLSTNSKLPKPNKIILSHAHWDHASGIMDFPELDIWVTNAERNYMKEEGPPAVFPSQVSSPSIKWRTYSLSADDYAGFSDSLDIYDDGTAVLVSLSGHSPGSVGLFVNTKKGKRYFFIGDAVWNLDGLEKLKSKFWISSFLVDHDKQKTNAIVAKIVALATVNPELIIVPAHDRRAWE
ncbi:MAG: MBL fold metallo-hydrolase [Gammaproteobacteria bacterium]|nr:MAG: MBL fold metallo-hydrolase [Gammaproteobacteria bacterium]